MSRAWMPFYIGDYRADTAHLGALEHGVYLLLIMHYWQTGGLPDDERQLARIACTTDTEWRRAKPIVSKFFLDGWKHKRIEFELTEAARLSAAGRAGGLASAEARRQRSGNDTGNDPPTTPQALQSHSPSQVESNNLSIGGVKGWTPPRHGQTAPKVGRVYVREGSEEWAAYAADFRGVHGADPVPNRHGGKWFKTAGEQPLEVRRNGRAII